MQAYKFKISFFYVLLSSYLLLTLPRISQAIEAGRVTWAFCASLSEPTCFSWVSSGAACYPSCLNGNPCAFYRGARRSDGLFWVLFLAAEKKYLARGANTAMPK